MQVDKRSRDLDDVLLKAITFQEELQKLLVWLQTQEDTFSEMEPVANDLETIKSQWNDIKVTVFYAECCEPQVFLLVMLNGGVMLINCPVAIGCHRFLYFYGHRSLRELECQVSH